jgi:hypothetical protein
MSATVIDALVLELGFETKDLEAGKKTLTDFFTKVAQGSDTSSKKVTEANKKQTDGFNKMRNELVALLAVFTAGKGIKEFVTDMTNSNAALGRFSNMLGLSSREVAQWRAGASLLGINAGDVDASFKSLTTEIQRFSLTGQSSVLPWFRMLGIQFTDINGKTKDAGQLWLELADRVKGMDHAKAMTILEQMGISDGMIQVILQGRGAVEELLNSQKQYADTLARDAGPAQERLKAWMDLRNTLTGLAVDILSAVTPAIVGVTKALAGFFKDHPDLGKGIIIALAGAVGLLSVALGIGGLVTAVSIGAAAIGTMAVAIGSMLAAAGPVLLTLAAIAAAVAGIVYVSDHWRSIWSGISGMFSGGGSAPPASTSAPSSPPASRGGRSPLSVRNNNPGNLRSWGNTPVSGGFAHFASAQDGISAAAGNLMNYSKRGWSTPLLIAKHWAPAGDGNDVDAYARAIASAAGVGVNDIMDLNNPGVANKVLSAIFKREAGYNAYSQSQVASGIADRMARYRGQASSQLASASSSSSSVSTASSTTHIGTLVINSSARDAAGIAGDIHAELLARNAHVQQANTGPT